MKTFVVAEIASNWEGSVATAKRLIRESKKSGADAVNFRCGGHQIYMLDIQIGRL